MLFITSFLVCSSCSIHKYCSRNFFNQCLGVNEYETLNRISLPLHIWYAQLLDSDKWSLDLGDKIEYSVFLRPHDIDIVLFVNKRDPAWLIAFGFPKSLTWILLLLYGLHSLQVSVFDWYAVCHHVVISTLYKWSMRLYLSWCSPYILRRWSQTLHWRNSRSFCVSVFTAFAKFPERSSVFYSLAWYSSSKNSTEHLYSAPILFIYLFKQLVSRHNVNCTKNHTEESQARIGHAIYTKCLLNKNVFKLRLNEARVSWLSVISCGKLFQISGAEKQKARLPNTVLGVEHWRSLWDADRP